MPGLGTSFGRGGATTNQMDVRYADAVLVMGSNMAECHPVAFRWVMKAKTREGRRCRVIHVDPRFTRTSAMADIYAPLRAGSDVLGGLYLDSTHAAAWRSADQELFNGVAGQLAWLISSQRGRAPERAIEAHDLRVRHAGKLTFMEFHLVVPGSMTVAESHAICDHIEETLRAEMHHLVITIHVEPEEKAKQRGVPVL